MTHGKEVAVVLGFGTGSFLAGREDALAVFLGFALLGMVLLFIVNRISERLDNRILSFQEAQIRSIRTHLAKFYILQRRKNRSFERRVIELEEVTRTVGAIDRNCKMRSLRVDNYYKMMGVVSENQRAIESHFNFRVARIEDKLMIAHDKAVARLALKGILTPEDEP